MTTRRVSYERLRELETELTARDRDVVAMLAAVRIASGVQLRRALWPDSSEATSRAARRTLLRLTRWRVIARLERRQGGLGRGSDSFTYALDTAGQRLVGRGAGARRPHLPRPAMWAHALTTAEIYTRLREGTRSSGHTVEAWQGEPQSWRTYAGPYGETVTVKPDAFVHTASTAFDDYAFIETDTGSQSPAVIRDKCLAYLRYLASGQEQERLGVFPQVVFLTTGPARLQVLVDLIGQLPAEQWRVFRVGLITDAARLLTEEDV